MKRFVIILLGSFSGALCFGQTTTQASYWFRYYLQAPLTENWSLHAEIDERRFVNPDRQAQFFTHLHVHKKLNPGWEFALGFNYNLTNSNSNPSLAVPELRPWQELTRTEKIRQSTIQFRYRTEQRFVHHSNSSDLTDGYRFAWRHRFRVQWSRPLPTLQSQLKLSNEVMLNSTSGIKRFDQNRVFVALEKAVSQRVSVEIGYLNLWQSKTSDGYFDRHIIRATVYHRPTFLLARKEG